MITVCNTKGIADETTCFNVEISVLIRNLC